MDVERVFVCHMSTLTYEISCLNPVTSDSDNKRSFWQEFPAFSIHRILLIRETFVHMIMELLCDFSFVLSVLCNDTDASLCSIETFLGVSTHFQ